MKYIIVKPARFIYMSLVILSIIPLAIIASIVSILWNFDTKWVKREIFYKQEYFWPADDSDYSRLQTGKPYKVYRTFWDYVNMKKTNYDHLKK